MTYNVYIYQNQVNQKYYVGYTSNFKRRESEHRRTNNSAPGFHGAIKKHGWENFKLISLMEVNTEEEMKELEQLMISDLNSYGENGYNLTPGGDGFPIGHVQSEEHKRKNSESHRGIIPWNKGLKNCIVPWNKGKTDVYSEEALEKKRIAMIGRKQSQETIDKRVKTRKESDNFIVTEETRQKISKANKGRKMSEEFCRKNSENKKGEKHHQYNKPRTEEVKQKISESLKGHIPWNKDLTGLKGNSQTEESKKKISEGNKNKPKSEEHRKAISKAKKSKSPSKESITKGLETRKKNKELKLQQLIDEQLITPFGDEI